MKTKEELSTLEAEVETVNKKLRELTGEELEQVLGGFEPGSYSQVKIPIFRIEE